LPALSRSLSKFDVAIILSTSGRATAVMTDNEVGLGVRVEEASKRRLSVALERLLYDPKFKASAKIWQQTFARDDSWVLVRQFLEKIGF
jgi:UDP:flavonoid glycosyltransferase YjiC (YdhE family)